MHRKALNIVAISLSLTVSACMSLPERNRDAGLTLSEYNLAVDEQNDSWGDGWWEHYNNEQLNTLIIRAFDNNPGLNQLRARLQQASANIRAQRSGLFPSTRIGIERTQFEGDTGLNFGPSAAFGLDGAASYELDVWGRTRSRVKAANRSQESSEEDLYAGGITLVANIVNSWLEIASLREQERIVRKQIETNRTLLDLQEKRFERGSAGALDVLQQEENLARSLSLLPDILSAEAQTTNNLAVLIGLTPSDAPKIEIDSLPAALDIPNSGVPSDLLNNRPDLRAAWATLMSEDLETRAAFADRLPRFELSANFIGNNERVVDLLEDMLISLVGGVTAPLNTTGSGQAVQAIQAGVAEESFYLYKEAVLQAVLDVENNLVQNSYQDQKLDALQKQRTASFRTLEQAQFSYANGEIGYINVLNSLTNVQSLELQIAQERLNQTQNRVNLYRALGGRSWAEKKIEQDLKDE